SRAGGHDRERAGWRGDDLIVWLGGGAPRCTAFAPRMGYSGRSTIRVADTNGKRTTLLKRMASLQPCPDGMAFATSRQYQTSLQTARDRPLLSVVGGQRAIVIAMLDRDAPRRVIQHPDAAAKPIDLYPLARLEP